MELTARHKELRRHLTLDPDPIARLVDGATYVLRNFTERIQARRPEDVVVDETNAKLILQKFAIHMLDRLQYAELAYIQWGEHVFNQEAESARRVWESLFKEAKLLIPGAGSLGKTYGFGVYVVLDYERDPLFTAFKIISVTAGHGKSNLFAHIKNLHESSAIPIPGNRLDRSIMANDDDKHGIHLLAIGKDISGEAVAKGFHPPPRVKPHHQFGNLSRLRVVLDEAEEIPSGVWQGVDNMMLTTFDAEHVKAFGAANPKNRNSEFGIRCEPTLGWNSLNIDSSFTWASKQGWHIERLDGARCENVIARKVIIPGFLTYEGFEELRLRGDQDPVFQSQGRGWFPEAGIMSVIISPKMLEDSRGSIIFTGSTIHCGAADLAFEGEDLIIFTIGEFGLATGYMDFLNNAKYYPEPKYAILAKQQIMLKKGNTQEVTDEIIRFARMLSIKPAMLAVDRTGVGTGVHDMLQIQYGTEVLGINYGEGATDRPIMLDDTKMASELYDGLVTELFFCMRRFMEFNVLKLGPLITNPRLFEELNTRTYKPVGGGKSRIQSKADYKKESRTKKSPDYADSLSMLLHVIRMNTEFAVSMLQMQETREVTPETSKFDNINYIEFKD